MTLRKSIYYLLVTTGLLAVVFAIYLSVSEANSVRGLVSVPNISSRNADSGSGTAEMTAYDPVTQRMFKVNATDATLNIIDMSDPNQPKEISQIDLTYFGAAAEGVDFHSGVLAINMENAISELPGKALFFDVDGNFLSDIAAGSQPHTIVFTPDEQIVLASDAGESSDDADMDPIAAANMNQGAAELADFELAMSKIGGYDSGLGEGAAEIVTYDPVTQRIFIVNATDVSVDIVDISDPTQPQQISQIDMTPYGAGVNSAAFNDGVLAVAVQNAVKQLPGKAVFFDADGNHVSDVIAGALPDMIAFSPDGQYVLVANEGEPSDDYTVDPEGTVSVIDLSGGAANLSQVNVATADFNAFDGHEEAMRSRGVRIYPDLPNNTVSKDVEPEYISFASDSATAFVTLQENNAFGVIDVVSATIKDILPLGQKDHSQGPATIQNYEWTDLPDLGTTDAGQTIKLGGFSGLWYEGMTPAGLYKFVTVPDRGPNGAPTDVNNDGQNERPFALPAYQARVVRFTLNPATGDFQITEEIMLTREDGTTPITGLPNIADVDETPVDLDGQLLPYDSYGADLEGIVVTASGDFWAVDEYRPAIYHFDAKGKLIKRLVPAGTGALAGQAAGTFGMETLPEEYSKRRSNRGFEAIALDTENDILYAFIQTPLANPDRAASDNSDVIRMLGIDPATGAPVAEYVYLLEGADYRQSKVDKIGDAFFTGGGKFVVIERDSSTTMAGKKFIFEADLIGATDVLNTVFAGTLEQETADSLAGLGIKAVHKRKILNLPSIGYLAGDKPEGLAVLPDGRMAVLNDNDFGLLDEEIPGDGTIGLDPDPTPVTLGIIRMDEGNQIDASDNDNGIFIKNWPVLGSYMPDAMASYSYDGMDFFVTANEGDARDYPGFSEELRMGDVEYVMDPTRFPNRATLQMEQNLGRLKTTNQFGDLDGDGDYDELHSYGARSFSIWDAYGNLVYDSSDDFEHITAIEIEERFNGDYDIDAGMYEFDSRSDDKGSEPESVVTGEVHGRSLAFIGLERVGGIMVYNVSHPTKPQFITYEPSADNDVSPEGLQFIAAQDSPTGKPLLVAAHEISG
ncbi:MAG: esterase-like activity of phytase family protein, partial [Candidatus Promineifilaceae bacterium]|nr:esterase-like activity of phytase family protein [Candidatus Promineifilaceae bacterium]